MLQRSSVSPWYCGWWPTQSPCTARLWRIVPKALWIHDGVIMRLFRLVIGQSLVAVGFVLTLVAFVLIANTGGGSPYMYVVWGLGLLTMTLGFNSLPKKKKQRRESP